LNSALPGLDHPRLKILYYTPFFNIPLTEENGFVPALAEDLCEVTTDHTRFEEADAVVFHLPNLKKLPVVPKRPGQLWVSLSMEPDALYPWQADPLFTKVFDLRMSFHLHADVRVPYFSSADTSFLRRPGKWKYRWAPAVYFASNSDDHNGRRVRVEELMKHLKVDSYGASLRNRHLRKDQGRRTKLKTISRYAFNLAFENSNEPDYVSEKVYDSLIAGTVPVYFGAPNVEEFLPGKNCVIKAADFSSPRELADYLRFASRNSAEYRKYLAWKNEPFQENFLQELQKVTTPKLRRLCFKIRERQQGLVLDGLG